MEDGDGVARDVEERLGADEAPDRDDDGRRTEVPSASSRGGEPPAVRTLSGGLEVHRPDDAEVVVDGDDRRDRPDDGEPGPAAVDRREKA
jgi:hypothetical protein